MSGKKYCLEPVGTSRNQSKLDGKGLVAALVDPSFYPSSNPSFNTSCKTSLTPIPVPQNTGRFRTTMWLLLQDLDHVIHRKILEPHCALIRIDVEVKQRHVPPQQEW